MRLLILLAKGHFVGILQFSAKGNAPGDRGDLYGPGLCAGHGSQFFTDVVDGGIALDGWAECKYDLGCFFRFDASDQCINGKFSRTDAVKRGDDSTQHMVNAIELLGAFYGDHIPDIFHHTDHILPAHGIAADVAEFFIGNILTTAAEFYLVPHFCDHRTELVHLTGILFNKMKHQP